MKRIEEQQNTLMYLSRLLQGHTRKGDAEKRVLVFTIQVKHLSNTTQLKKAIYQKVHRALYEKLSSPDKSNFSLFIASDVESSRYKYVPDEVLLNPILPHYHGLIVFNKPDWDHICENLSYWKGKIRSSISDIKEIKDRETDGYGCIKSESIWIDVFDEKKVKGAKHQSPLGDYIQYSMKSHLQGVNRSILIHEPSVFPFDIYASDQDVICANRLFNELWKQQVQSFEKS
ncbi:hypothetical protein [Roseovarius sp.]|uniref:hypothetical protein n=1 Tax=Roseovarius sp. TaxID=1486281 RepID=UPI002612D6B6|nr:hypothetical protein [Roseovarius sp.]